MTVRPWILGAMFFLVGCGGGTGSTEVLIEVSSEPAVTSLATLLNVRVYQGTPSDTVPNELVEDYSIAQPTFPTTLTVEPADDTMGRYRVVVAALGSNGATVTQATAIGSFVRRRSVRVNLALEIACQGVTCEVSQTCRGGVCVDAETGGGMEPLPEGSCAIGFAASPDCTVGCPTALRHVSSGYVPATREGYWLCSDFAASTELNATSASGDYRVRGFVPVAGTSGTSLEGTAPDGTMYSVRAR